VKVEIELYLYKDDIYVQVEIYNYQFSSRFLEFFFFFPYVFHLIWLLAMEKGGWICYNKTM
jgi:hypothetical protein